MSRSWNGKAVIDAAATELWDSSERFRVYIIRWANEIMDDIATRIPVSYYNHRLEKLLPTNQDIINLSPLIPTAPTTALAAGGSLVDAAAYKVSITFVMYDKDLLKYVESEQGEEGTERTAGSGNNTINLTAIPVHPVGTNMTVYRNVYLAKKASGDTSYGEPFYVGQIANNTATTYSITADATSTITPPSDSEVDQISPKQMILGDNGRYLERIDLNQIRRYDTSPGQSTTPDAFDIYGTDSIVVYPRISTSASTAQRTLDYYVLRRPHEIFYDVTRAIDLPIQAKRALMQGLLWKGYQFRDRSGAVEKRNEYEESKREFLKKIARQIGSPGSIRDVNGDTDGYEV